MNKIRVLVVDNHAVVRNGLKAYLSDTDIQVIAEASNGNDAVIKSITQRPDVVITNIDMPVLNGIEATKQITSTVGNSKVIIFTRRNDHDSVYRAIQAGASAYVTKTTCGEKLPEIVRKVKAGERYFSPEIVAYTKNPKPKLTPREVDVIRLISDGLSNKQVADRLCIGVRTVETHRERILKKANARGAGGLTRYAIENGHVEVVVA